MAAELTSSTWADSWVYRCSWADKLHVTWQLSWQGAVELSWHVAAELTDCSLLTRSPANHYASVSMKSRSSCIENWTFNLLFKVSVHFTEAQAHFKFLFPAFLDTKFCCKMNMCTRLLTPLQAVRQPRLWCSLSQIHFCFARCERTITWIC